MKLVAFALLAGCATSAADPAPGKFSKADFDAHIKALRARLAKAGLKDLTIRVEEPFVVVGDGTQLDLDRGTQTVRWASDMLEQDFFAKRPSKILDVYLFSTASSYERGVKILHGEAPSTPYGFYASTDSALYMNIATGGGTLVHELVHPYVEADFPNAPAWLNEGLGSLFEQSAEKDGHIVGLTNWRLAGLQKAIGKKSVPTFQRLTSLDDSAFYNDERGTNYAQSRYLLYYMQEKGLVRDFYKAFRAARGKDPTGYATLVAKLGEKDMAAFQTRWEAYVAKLRFP